jgi:hypothetical protein
MVDLTPPPGFVRTEINTTQAAHQIPEMLACVEINCRRKNIEFLRIEPERAGPCVIVGGGPSVATRLDALRALRRKPGSWLIGMNDAPLYLNENGIECDAAMFWETEAVLGDARLPYQPLPLDYYIASRAHPDWYALVYGHRIVAWHCRDDVGEREIIDQYDPGPVMVAGGTAGALRTIEIGRARGFREFHLFGIDGSYDDPVRSHAYPSFETDRSTITAWCNGKSFETKVYYMQQARDLVDQYRAYQAIQARDGTPFRMVVHADGLIPHFAAAHGIPVM